MLRLFSLYLLLCLSTAVIAQVPQAFSYQAIVTTEGGEVIQEQAVGVQVDILDDDINGPVIYRETHDVTTNMNGIYTLNIGQGSQVQGDFIAIDWGSGSKFLSISQDVSGGSSFQFVGASQLLSVPYALYADQVEPIVYVQEALDNPRNVLDLSEEDPSFIISVLYQWIQGVPEDVFVEYNNLPANTHLRLRAELGRFTGEDRDNFTAVDTIFDGIRIRTNELVRTDPNVALVPGDYTIEIVYRTADAIVGTVSYPFTITEGNPPDPTDNCSLAATGEVYRLDFMDCGDELEQFIATEVTFVTESEDELSVELFEFSEQVRIRFFDNGRTCDYDVSRGDFQFEDENFTYEGRVRDITVDGDEFTLELMVMRFVQGEDTPPNDISCTLRYTSR